MKKNSLEFYDFSKPNNLPLEYICSTYDMGNELDTDYEVTPIGWKNKEEFVLNCTIEEKEVEKSINILSYKKR